MLVRPEQRVAAYAICSVDGNVLLTRYIGSGEPTWTLPGGGVEQGEDPFHAVVREVAEETGYTAEVVALLGIYSTRRTHPRGPLVVADHHTIGVMYAVRITGGDLRHEVGGTTDRAAWVPLAELPSPRGDLVDVGLSLARLRPITGHPDDGG